ncbi:protein MFI isoform X7 [Balaenoptera acutorostrata]|uniref:Protein MFI isoform X7 n=1 Tax=Balaenoptera acutorostrata TaxID=9767 RepID=A0ABM3U1C5_BALAC|nr:protein MFI isoform X7 [Balaenoptera acutorostrata]
MVSPPPQPDFCMAWKQESEFTKRDRAARVIQKAWKSFLNVAVFQHFKSLINIRRQGDPRQILRYINPKEAELLDAAAGINVRFRLGGFWKSTENVMVGDKKESEFHFSKLKRRQDIEKKRKIKKIEWMRQMYYTGTLEAKSTNHETLGLIHTATKGLIKAFEDGGIDSVMEWEVDEVLNWTNTLNFDEYIANWKEIATSNSSANFKSFRFEQAQEKKYDYKDILEEEMGTQEDTSFDSIYEGPTFTRLRKKATENKQAQRTRFSRLLHRLLRTCSSLSLHDP